MEHANGFDLTSRTFSEPEQQACPNCSTSTSISEQDSSSDLLQLNYSLRDHKTILIPAVAILAFESTLLPIVLVYPFWFASDFPPVKIFDIVTSCVGIVSLFEFFYRTWRLGQKDDTYRPLGAKRWHFDFTHHTLLIAYIVAVAVLVLGENIQDEPLIRPLAMPASLLLVQVGLQCLATGCMSAWRVPAVVRVSSLGRGEVQPPLVLTLLEDVVAVDLGAGRAYRQAVMARYRASKKFRHLIRELNWFWGGGCVGFGATLLLVVWTVPERVAYGVGWATPLGFVLVWSTITIYWVRRSLTIEKKLWTGGTKLRDGYVSERMQEVGSQDEHDPDV